jgi:hypothetical protein
MTHKPDFHDAASDLDQLASIAFGMPIAHHAFPSHSWKTWMRALIWSIRLLRAFECGGSQQAYILLKSCQLQSMYGSDLSDEACLFKARQDVTFLRAWIHLIGKPHACFGESFALCAGLRCLGFDCHLLVGYAQIEQFVSTPLHSWVAYKEEPITDLLEVMYAYCPLYCDGLPIRSQQQERKI